MRKGQVFNEFVLTIVFMILILLFVGMVLFIFGVIASQYYLVHYTLTKFVEHPQLYEAFKTRDFNSRLGKLRSALTDALNAGNSFASSLFGAFLKVGSLKGCVTPNCQTGNYVIELINFKIGILTPSEYFIEPVELQFEYENGTGNTVTITYSNYFSSIDSNNLDLYPVIAVARASFPPPFSLVGFDFTIVSQKVPKFLRDLRGVSGQPTYTLSHQNYNSQNTGNTRNDDVPPSYTETPCPISTIIVDNEPVNCARATREQVEQVINQLCGSHTAGLRVCNDNSTCVCVESEDI